MALDFAQTHLAEKSEDCADIRSQLEQTLALLAFEDPESSPFGELMHLSQRQKVYNSYHIAVAIVLLTMQTC